jgi:hypothetical protein
LSSLAHGGGRKSGLKGYREREAGTAPIGKGAWKKKTIDAIALKLLPSTLQPQKPLANDSSSPQRGYSPPRVAEGGAGGASSSSAAADPFAGSDAFGAAGEFRPPSASGSPQTFGAADAGAAFGGGRGASPGRGTSPSRIAAAPAVPAVLPFNDTPVPPVSTTAAAPPAAKKSSAAAAAGRSGSGNNGRAALLGGSPAPSSGALGGTTNNGGGDDSSGNSKAPIFSLRRHRSHFNVDTADVLRRMRDSVACILRPDFLERVGDSPDLYGPFWIATTLVFLSAVAGNVAAWASWKRKHGGGGGGIPPSPSPTPSPAPSPPSPSSALSSFLLAALAAKGSPSSPDPVPAWLYDVNKVGYSAVLFYGYVAVVGGALFAVLRFVFRAPRSNTSSEDPSVLSSPVITLPAVWCAYGYSLTPFIPVSMLAVIPNEAARWSLIALAAALSGAFLLLNFRGSVYGCAGPKALPTTVAMGCAHAGLAVALKLYIFHYWK